MITNPFDILRFVMFAEFGLGVGFMLATNVMAFIVLRPPKKMGFLWWHVSAISVSFLCLGSVALERVLGVLGTPPTWRTSVTAIGVTTFLAAQLIIFNVERERLLYTKARRQAAERGKHEEQDLPVGLVPPERTDPAAEK